MVEVTTKLLWTLKIIILFSGRRKMAEKQSPYLQLRS